MAGTRGSRERLCRGLIVAIAWLSATITCAAAGTAPVPDTTAQRLLACTACHGKEGVATPQGYFPRIAGKPAGYLHNQLRNFREGRRENTTMAALLAHMTDAYLAEIASYYATLELPYAPPEAAPDDAPTLARGRLLVEHGDGSAGVPACARCHGAALTGATPAVPGLLGLRKEYLLAQFGAWRTGRRRAPAPDCMGDISRRLSAADLNAVTSYLAARPVPEPATPASGIALPAGCGMAQR